MPAPSHILVPLDLTEGSRAVLEYALQIAEPFKARIGVLHAWEPPQYVAPDLLVAAPGWNSLPLEQMAMETAGKDVKALLQQVSNPQVPVEPKTVVGEVASTILEEAERGKYDLIIMGTHGRRGLPRLLLGSVAQKVVSRAPCPVLTLHVASEK